MVFPWISFLKERKKRLSDIEFLSIKEFDGKIRSDEGFLSATGDLATLTATSGKDMYLARAKVIFFINSESASVAAGDEVVLKLNGVIKETSRSTTAGTGGGGGNGTVIYEFKNIGQKVLATQIIKLEVITLDTQSDVEGFIECFEETTGESPAV